MKEFKEKLNISITLTDESGIVKGKSDVTLETYKGMKELHDISILDETLEMMLDLKKEDE